MPLDRRHELKFESRHVVARIIDLDGEAAERHVEIRTHPITGRTCRVAFSRVSEKETGTEALPPPPPNWNDASSCPFCRPQLIRRTPRLHPQLCPEGRLVRGDSVLFPNLFPYGSYSAVSLFDNSHYVEIGRASLSTYTDSLINCRDYLQRVYRNDSQAVFMAITQNHLPSAGGSLLHPHLQINADPIAPNHHRFLLERAAGYFRQHGKLMYSRYLEHEKRDGSRYIGPTGRWEWVSAFAPEGFFEIWGILPGTTSLLQLTDEDCHQLARGVINTQRYYRSLHRNGYNLGLLAVEQPSSPLEMRAVLMVRSNYAPWVRNDHTGFEVMLGDMTTFAPPEDNAFAARPFFT